MDSVTVAQLDQRRRKCFITGRTAAGDMGDGSPPARQADLLLTRRF